MSAQKYRSADYLAGDLSIEDPLVGFGCCLLSGRVVV